MLESPATATGIASNVTIDTPSAASYLTVFPSDAERPLASNLNWIAGNPPLPNQVTVGLSATGGIKIYNRAGTVNVVVDIVGFYQPATASAPGEPVSTPGAPGPQGPQGIQGPQGPQGPAGSDGAEPAHVVWVATRDGDFTSLSAALASITDASATNTYLIRIAPGVYTETGSVALKNYVDVEGSGESNTVITSAGSSSGYEDASTIKAVSNVRTSLSQLTVRNTGGASYSVGVYVAVGSNGAFSADHLTVTTANSVSNSWGLMFWGSSNSASLKVSNATISATGNGYNVAIATEYSGKPVFTDVSATATGGTNSIAAYLESQATSSYTNLVASATGASQGNYGVFSAWYSTVTLVNANVSVSGSTAWALRSNDSTSYVRQSVLKGTTAVVNITSYVPSIAKIADSQVDGSVSGTGITCVTSYNAAYTPVGAGCA